MQLSLALQTLSLRLPMGCQVIDLCQVDLCQPDSPVSAAISVSNSQLMSQLVRHQKFRRKRSC